MTKTQAMEIIKKEKLSGYNLNEQRGHKEDELGIRYMNEKWVVYATDERASVFPCSECFFDSESDAWVNLIERLRADKILNEP